jgi:predicted metal-dependent hydrolase
MPGRSSIISSTAVSEAAGEDFALALDSVVLAVRVRRHPASRRLRLRLDAPKGELRLTLPPRHSLARARHWVEQQRGWVMSQLDRPRPQPLRIAPGVAIPWQGSWLPIAWDAALPRQPVLSKHALAVGGPVETLGPRIARWLKARALAEFEPATRAMAQAAGLDVTRVAVGDPRARWGSCSSSGAIRYSWRLAMAPDFVRHAIVAHEVAHLAHMNHGPAFHALADRLGGAEAQGGRQWLRSHGAALHAVDFG